MSLPLSLFLCASKQGKGISGPEDTFSFNGSFTSKLKRVRIPLVSVKDSASGPASSNSLPPAVEEDRRYVVDGVFVNAPGLEVLFTARSCFFYNGRKTTNSPKSIIFYHKLYY